MIIISRYAILNKYKICLLDNDKHLQQYCENVYNVYNKTSE